MKYYVVTNKNYESIIIEVKPTPDERGYFEANLIKFNPEKSSEYLRECSASLKPELLKRLKSRRHFQKQRERIFNEIDDIFTTKTTWEDNDGFEHCTDYSKRYPIVPHFCVTSKEDLIAQAQMRNMSSEEKLKALQERYKELRKKSFKAKITKIPAGILCLSSIYLILAAFEYRAKFPNFTLINYYIPMLTASFLTCRLWHRSSVIERNSKDQMHTAEDQLERLSTTLKKQKEAQTKEAPTKEAPLKEAQTALNEINTTIFIINPPAATHYNQESSFVDLESLTPDKNIDTEALIELVTEKQKNSKLSTINGKMKYYEWLEGILTNNRYDFKVSDEYREQHPKKKLTR